MKPLLLDTCALLWMSSEPTALSGRARAEMARADAALFVSAITAWEIGVKQKRGKLSLPERAGLWFPSTIALLGVQVIAMDEVVALVAATLD